MIKALINGGIIEYLTDTICMLPGIIIALCLHEYAHAVVAYKCGDPTPKYMGRVTVNPKAHIDWIGFLCLILVHFGWGKPVIINPDNFNKKRRDSIFVGFAGVTMNFLVALAVGLIIRFALMSPSILHFIASTDAGDILFNICLDIVVINFSLMFFNLLPVPPLDGFGIISDLLNLRGTKVWNMVYRYGTLILLVILIADIPSFLFTKPLNWLINTICFSGL